MNTSAPIVAQFAAGTSSADEGESFVPMPRPDVPVTLLYGARARRAGNDDPRMLARLRPGGLAPRLWYSLPETRRGPFIHRRESR